MLRNLPSSKIPQLEISAANSGLKLSSFIANMEVLMVDVVFFDSHSCRSLTEAGSVCEVIMVIFPDHLLFTLSPVLPLFPLPHLFAASRSLPCSALSPPCFFFVISHSLPCTLKISSAHTFPFCSPYSFSPAPTPPLFQSILLIVMHIADPSKVFAAAASFVVCQFGLYESQLFERGNRTGSISLDPGIQFADRQLKRQSLDT